MTRLDNDESGTWAANADIEVALDHALAGWREVPIVERFGPDASPSSVGAWKQ